MVLLSITECFLVIRSKKMTNKQTRLTMNTPYIFIFASIVRCRRIEATTAQRYLGIKTQKLEIFHRIATAITITINHHYSASSQDQSSRTHPRNLHLQPWHSQVVFPVPAIRIGFLEANLHILGEGFLFSAPKGSCC